MAVSDETKDFLEQVKKGKPRKFVLLTKGAKIVNLILFKKGAPSKFVKEAKEEGAGVPCFGVATGKGMDITFQLAIDDGFDKAPVKDLVLKNYLEEEAGFKCKPLIEVVQSRGLALDPDDPLHARFISLKGAALKACDDAPGEATKINDLCARIGALLDEDDRKPAEAQLGELEKLLAGLKSDSSSSPEADKQEKSYHALCAKLEPLLLQTQKAVPDKALALGNLWAYASAQAEGGNFAVANKALAGLADALAKAKAGATNVDVLAVWLEAKEAADAQLNRFTDALRKSGDEYLIRIADGGVHSFVEGPTRVFVKLQAALMEFKSAQGPARDKVRTVLLKAIGEYGKYLDGNKFLEVCDTNELCGPLTIRTTLKSSLEQLEQALAV